MIADRSTRSARATSHPQMLTPDLQRCIRNRLPVQNRLPPPSETRFPRQYSVRSPSPTASDAHRHRLRRHGPAGPDDIAHDLGSRRPPPILQSNRGVMPDAILELAFDHPKIRHRDRPPTNTPIFAIDSLPSHTVGSLSRMHPDPPLFCTDSVNSRNRSPDRSNRSHDPFCTPVTKT